MRKAAKRTKAKQLHLRLDTGELVRIKHDARSLGMTVTEYVKTCIEVFEGYHGRKVRNVMEEYGKELDVWDALSAY